MKINEMINLYIGFNKMENFKVLICALDVKEAQKIANEYRVDSHMDGNFKITEFNNIKEQFDCEYVLTSCQ